LYLQQVPNGSTMILARSLFIERKFMLVSTKLERVMEI
jgi:hypothetical protein